MSEPKKPVGPKTFPYKLMVLLCYPEYSEGTIVALSQSMRRVRCSRLRDTLHCTTHKILESLEFLRQAGLVISVTVDGDSIVLVAIRKPGHEEPILKGP